MKRRRIDLTPMETHGNGPFITEPILAWNEYKLIKTLWKLMKNPYITEPNLRNKPSSSAKGNQ